MPSFQYTKILDQVVEQLVRCPTVFLDKKKGNKLNRTPTEIKGNETALPHIKTEFAPQC